MITKQEAREILQSHGLRHWSIDVLKTRSVIVCLGECPDRYVVYFDPRKRTMYIGDPVIGHTEPWNDWWDFTPGEIGLRGINLTWWRLHKLALQEMVALIESKFSGPVNCRPDICL